MLVVIDKIPLYPLNVRLDNTWDANLRTYTDFGANYLIIAALDVSTNLDLAVSRRLSPNRGWVITKYPQRAIIFRNRMEPLTVYGWFLSFRQCVGLADLVLEPSAL